MRVLDAIAVAATSALLAVATPTLACDYSMKRDVTAEAPQPAAPAHTAEATQPAAAPAPATTTPSVAASDNTAAPTQTATADLETEPVARPN